MVFQHVFILFFGSRGELSKIPHSPVECHPPKSLQFPLPRCRCQPASCIRNSSGMQLKSPLHDSRSGNYGAKPECSSLLVLFISLSLSLSLALLSSLLHILGTFANARRLQARIDLCSCSTPRSQSLSDSSLSAHGGEWGR